mmetsp:Transcript_42628/g.89460  ORF Transcript_42628/g.89460 Transcript_42628/m.89460 type:complete len:91 (-) Transcript_42628:607-879(-)
MADGGATAQGKMRLPYEERDNAAKPKRNAVLPKNHTEALLSRIKKLVGMWAEEEQQMNGNTSLLLEYNEHRKNEQCSKPSPYDIRGTLEM